MKMKLISTAVAAGLGLSLMSTAAQAVYVNANGTGQALLYPYVTTESGYNTNVAIVNTTNNAKLVKVRFLEAKNSNETLDFNLYLSAHDEWTGAVVDNGTGPMLVTKDTSCTAPKIPAAGVAFRNTVYAANGDSDTSVARAREGYMEVISMGDIVSTSSLANAITHVNGVPANCDYVVSNATNSTLMDGQLTADTGGLYGYGALFNVNRGTSAAYDATALDSFVGAGGNLGYSQPGSLQPNLGQANPATSVTFNGTANATVANWSSGWDAVSAVLMATDLVNDYVVDPALSAGTDWVVTFPTKNHYVNAPAALPPFTVAWDKTKSQACEPIAITYYDREERTNTSPIDFSPMPTTQGASLCYEANTISFNGQDVLGAVKAGATGAGYTLNLATGFTAGWADLNLASVTGHTMTSTGTPAVTFKGLPAIGFAITQYTNGNVPNPDATVGGLLLANYDTLTNHKKLEINP